MKNYIEQINKIRMLKDNWYKEGVGKSYSSDDLDWFLKQLCENYSEEFPKIYIYPSYEDDTLSIECDYYNLLYSVYINIKKQNAIITSYYCDQCEEFVINDNFWAKFKLMVGIK